MEQTRADVHCILFIPFGTRSPKITAAVAMNRGSFRTGEVVDIAIVVIAICLDLVSDGEVSWESASD